MLTLRPSPFVGKGAVFCALPRVSSSSGKRIREGMFAGTITGTIREWPPHKLTACPDTNRGETKGAKTYVVNWSDPSKVQRRRYAAARAPAERRADSAR